MPEIGVGRHERREAITLCRVKQLTVLELRPPGLVCGSDLVLRQELTQGCRSALIEQNAHLRWGKRAPRSMLQHGANLFNSDAREPLDKLRDECAVFQVFKQSGYGHARTRKHPRATNAVGIAFNRGA